jgi:hypothetical protein
MKSYKKAVGLLQEDAPENHFLAYINTTEAKALKEMGGSGKMTPQGILSFEPEDGYEGEVSSSFGGYGGGGFSDNTDSEENQPYNNQGFNFSGSSDDSPYDGTEDLETQREIDIQVENDKYFDYETEAYKNVEAKAVPTFEQGSGKFTGTKTVGQGVVTAADYNLATTKGIMLDDTISKNDKVEFLNTIQSIVNSKRDSGKPAVDFEGKEFIQDNLEKTLAEIKNNSFYDTYTKDEKFDANSQTYNDAFLDAPFKTLGTSSIGITGVSPVGGAMKIMFNSLKDSFKNKQALDMIGYDGTKLKPNYAEVGDGGGILTDKEYLLGNTLNSDQINQAIPNLRTDTNNALPDSVVNRFYDNKSFSTNDFKKNYNEALAKITNTTQNNKYNFSGYNNIFYDYLNERGLI